MSRILVLLICTGLGTLIVWKTKAIVDITGEIGWAQRHLGGAGTFTLYKLIGVFIIVCGMLYAAGMVENIVNGLVSFLFPAPVPTDTN